MSEAGGKIPGFKQKEMRKMKMVCQICGRNAEYNERMNIYYCKEHGFTTWIREENALETHIEEAIVHEEAILG